MRCFALTSFVTLLCLVCAACGGGRGAGYTPPTSPTPTPTPTPVTVTAADMAYCIDAMNAYRSSVGRPAMTRDSRLEQIATNAAKQDYLARVPHQHFTQTGGEGYATAENEVVTSPTHYGSVRGGIDFGIKAFWSEGPGGGHYQNIVNNSRAGCGYYLDTGTDTLYLAVDFR